MKPLSRTRSELALGAWALAPVALFAVLMATWQHHASAETEYVARGDWSYQPVTAWMLAELIGLIVLVVIVMALLLRDLSRRSVTDRLRTFWKVMIILGTPFGGLAYWALHCCGGSPSLRSGAERA